MLRRLFGYLTSPPWRCARRTWRSLLARHRFGASAVSVVTVFALFTASPMCASWARPLALATHAPNAAVRKRFGARAATLGAYALGGVVGLPSWRVLPCVPDPSALRARGVDGDSAAVGGGAASSLACCCRRPSRWGSQGEGRGARRKKRGPLGGGKGAQKHPCDLQRCGGVRPSPTKVAELRQVARLIDVAI